MGSDTPEKSEKSFIKRSVLCALLGKYTTFWIQELPKLCFFFYFQLAGFFLLLFRFANFIKFSLPLVLHHVQTCLSRCASSPLCRGITQKLICTGSVKEHTPAPGSAGPD